jgi:hypothetical protein
LGGTWWVGLLPLAGLFGVSGTIKEASRQAAPVPAQRTAVISTQANPAGYDGHRVIISCNSSGVPQKK